MSFEFRDAVTQKMMLSELHPADYNPRKITDRALTGLGQSMERFGDLADIVWNKRSGNIVGGHQRYRKLLDAGVTDTEVVVVDLDGNEEVALNIALNSQELRGDFTAEVKKQLALCEVRMGDGFSDVGLMDLFGLVKKMKFDDEVKPLQNLGVDGTHDGGAPSGDVPSGGGAGKNQDVPEGPDGIITCPKCQSTFKMKDNSVVHNTNQKGESGDA